MSECKVCKEQFHYCSSCSLDPEHPRTYGFCSWNCMMEDKDAALAQLREEVERLKAKLDRSHLYRNSSYWQEKAMAVLRGEFTQCCSYCGFEAQPPNGWDELQKHIVECTEHPLTALRARCEAAEKELAECRGKVEKVRAAMDRKHNECDPSSVVLMNLRLDIINAIGAK